jgi:glutamine synthetase
VLEHISALALLSLPLASSYKRMVDGVWSGGTYVSWGIEQKETPVRLCNPHSPSSRNFEFKTLDGTANPYLALAGVLMAGLSGIVELKELTMKDCSGEASAAGLGEEGRAKLGIKERFPLSWEDAYSKFEASGIEKAVRSLEGRDSCTSEMSQHWTGVARASVTARTRVISRRDLVDIESKTSQKSLLLEE